jgi:hypothetical protein
LWVRFEVAGGGADANAVCLHRGQVGAASDERDILSSDRQLGAEVGADSAGSIDGKAHAD